MRGGKIARGEEAEWVDEQTRVGWRGLGLPALVVGETLYILLVLGVLELLHCVIGILSGIRKTARVQSLKSPSDCPLRS